MRIYYIGNFDNEFSTEQYIFEALLEQGYDVKAVQEDLFTSKEHYDMAQGYDLLLLAKGRLKDGLPGLVRLLQEFKGKKAFWLFDKMFDFRPERAEWMTTVIPLVDIYFVTDGSARHWYDRFNVPYKILRQGVLKGYYGQPKRLYQDFQVAFIGSLYTEERKKMLDELGQEFKVLVMGTHDMYQVRGQKLADICASVPVIVADSLGFDYYWSNRIYETLGAGGFLIHPNIKGLDEEFIDGQHYTGYKLGDWVDLKEKVSLALQNTVARQFQAVAGQKLVLDRYTYGHRVRTMMRNIFSTMAN